MKCWNFQWKSFPDICREFNLKNKQSTTIKHEWKITMSPVLQKIDRKWIDCQSSGEVWDISSLHFCSNEVKGETAHRRRQDMKENVGACIYLTQENSLWILQNPSTGYSSYDSIFVQFIEKPLCSITYSGSIWKTDLDIKIILCKICPFCTGKQARKKETHLIFQLCSHQRRTLQPKFKF